MRLGGSGEANGNDSDIGCLDFQLLGDEGKRSE